MNENLSLDITARILPQIEGAAQFEQQLKDLPGRMQERVEQVISSPGFEQGLADEQIAQAQQWMKYSQGMYEPFQQRIDELLKDFSVDLSGGNLTQGQMGKYKRKLERLKTDFGDFIPDVMDDFADFTGGSFGSERSSIMKGGLKQGFEDVAVSIDNAKDKMLSWNEALKQGKETGENFFSELKRAGIFAVGGMALNEGIKWMQTEAQIGAKDITSFDLTNPIGMYSERKQFELFESTREREMLYSSIGMAVGSVLGTLVMPGWGTVGGGMVGSQIGGSIAGFFNIGEQAKTEEELKMLNQTYGTLGGYVNSMSNYDIMRAKGRARFGSGIEDESIAGFGYTQDQQAQMKFGFSDAWGKYDPTLIHEQTIFARTLGLDPSQIYGLDASARITGQDVGLSGLHQAREFTQGIFGADASGQRVYEVLKEIQAINEKMLGLNINADSRESLRFAAMPMNLFGTDNAYGRFGDLGGSTIKNLEGLTNPKSDAHLAFLFQAMGTDNIMDFNEMMKGGIYSGDNLQRIMGLLKNTTSGNPLASYFALNTMMPEAPAGMLPQMMKLLSGEDFTITDRAKNEKGEWYKGKDDKWVTEDRTMNYETFFKEFKEGKSPEEILGHYENSAKNKMSKQEEANEYISNKMKEAADITRETMLKANKEMADFWADMAKNSEVQKGLADKIDIGMDAMLKKMIETGLVSTKSLSAKTIIDLFRAGDNPFNQSEFDEFTESDAGAGLRFRRNEIMDILNPRAITTYDKYKSPQESRDEKTKEFLNSANWSKRKYQEFEELFSGTELNKKYKVGFLDGYRPDGKGHTENSPHYKDEAWDFSLTDKTTGKILPKAQYDDVILNILDMLEEKMGVYWGGHFKTGKYAKDNNHYQKYAPGEQSEVPIKVEISFDNITYDVAQKISNSHIVVKRLGTGLNF